MNFTRPEEQLPTFIGKVTLFFIPCRIWVKNCQFCGRKFSAGLSKMQSESPGDHFEEKLFSKRKSDICSCWWFWTSCHFFQNFDKNIWVRLSNLHFMCPVERFEQKFVFWKSKFYFIFVTLVSSLRLLAKTLEQCCHNGFLGIQMNVLGKLKFFEINNFSYFPVPWPENFSASRWKHFVRVDKKDFHVSWGTDSFSIVHKLLATF